MTTRTFDELPVSEQENFFDVCSDANLAPEAFNVSFTEEIAEGDTKPYERSVIVQFGAIVRAYDGSDGADWTIDFAQDITSGVFV
jgi:hypothetical protein